MKTETRGSAELQTARMTLKPCCPADAAEFIALERDPDVMRYLDGGLPSGDGLASPDEGFLRPRGTESWVWAARLKSDAAFVGWFCLYPMSETVAELGYRLRRSQWGQGLATEGARALVGWGFSCHAYDVIVANTMAVNQASRRVLERLGFRYLRTVHLDWPNPVPGSEQGDVEYELMRANWSTTSASVGSHSGV